MSAVGKSQKYFNDTERDNTSTEGHKFSLNLKNSIYSKINHDPSHMLLPSTSARNFGGPSEDVSIVSGYPHKYGVNTYNVTPTSRLTRTKLSDSDMSIESHN
jgi:hypothetical protein